MVISYTKRLFKQLSKSKWIKIYFALVIIQTILSIPILVKTLVNTEDVRRTLPINQSTDYADTLFGNYLITKEYKIIYENVLFIVYEVWRLWILTDGIVHLNSLTILASAWFSVFSCIFNVMLVMESRNWASFSFDSLKLENMRLQIALTVVFFLLSIPVIIAAYKSSKEIGWEVYKKIGSSNHLKYLYHDVQRFALILKVNIFFQLFLLIGTTIISRKIAFVVISVAFSILLAIGLMFARVAISRESRWMMSVFLLLQVFLLACDIYCFIGLFEYPLTDIWHIGVVYETMMILYTANTIIFSFWFSYFYHAVQCQFNFGKGLKPFVEWYPFQSRKEDKKEGHNPAESGLRTRKIDECVPIDDDEDEEQDVGLLNKQDQFYGKNDEIPRASLERVDLVPYQIKVDRHQGLYKLDSIEFNNSAGYPVHKLEAQTLTRSSFSANSISNESDLSVTSRPPPYSNVDSVISLPQSDKW
ncbi:hypothetical protein MFLAVUS_000113 [Mucor flavus]|uniref:Uncharacterized protein n=1 Tax=Mucor flavus TaxID=439312 RepID=A0ABP9YIT4_9FUNG